MLTIQPQVKTKAEKFVQQVIKGNVHVEKFHSLVFCKQLQDVITKDITLFALEFRGYTHFQPSPPTLSYHTKQLQQTIF